jgi:hypothetical protein
MRIKNKELSDLDRKLKIFEEEAAASQHVLERQRAQMVQEKQAILNKMEQHFKKVLLKMFEENESKRKMDISKFNELQDSYIAQQKEF